MTEDFEKIYYEQSELWDKDRLDVPVQQQRMVETIALIPADVQTILDAACGNGMFIHALPKIYKVVGLDLSREALRHVRAQKIQGSIGRLPFDTESFDLITCLEVLEHLPRETFARALAEIERVARKYIIVSVPNQEDLEYSLSICPSCRCRFNPHRHVRSFSPSTLHDLFKGFAVTEVKEIGPLESRHSYNRSVFAGYRTWLDSSPRYGWAICPQCGYQTEKRKENQKPNYRSHHRIRCKTISLVVSLGKRIWRPKKVNRWLLVLYVKRGMRLEG